MRALVGLEHGHDVDAIAYSVVEGVTFGLLDGWRALDAPAGSVASLALVGGGARSAFWGRLLASALGVPLTRATGSEAGGAIGAARLAWLADGGDAREACRPAAVDQAFEPDAAEGALLALRHARFRALYPAVAGGNHGEVPP